MVIHNLKNIISFACHYRSYESFQKNISISRQVHHLTQTFSPTGRPCVRIRSLTDMLIHSIVPIVGTGLAHDNRSNFDFEMLKNFFFDGQGGYMITL